MDFYLDTYFRGLYLGLTIVISSFFMDIFISKKSLDKLHHEQILLYIDGWKAVLMNLLLIEPLFYAPAAAYLMKPGEFVFSNIEWIPYMELCLIHNFLYYVVHRNMHRTKALQGIHLFHHKFDEVMLPSIGNAVSREEFILAYTCPFIVGIAIVPTNEISFLLSALTIGAFNMFIHCREFREIHWLSFMISPEKHITHHEKRMIHYAAPLLDLDMIFEPKTNVGPGDTILIDNTE